MRGSGCINGHDAGVLNSDVTGGQVANSQGFRSTIVV